MEWKRGEVMLEENQAVAARPILHIQKDYKPNVSNR